MWLKETLKTNKSFRLLMFGALLVILMEIISLSINHQIKAKLIVPRFLFSLFMIFSFGSSVIKQGFKALLSLEFSDIRLLMILAVLGAFYLYEYEEAAVIIVIYSLGESLEEIGIKQSQTALDQLLKKTPKTARLLDDLEPISTSEIQIGQTIVVSPGEHIALDGEVVFGESTVDESIITGEYLPKTKQIGDLVFAGSINKYGALQIKVTHTSQNTALNRIIEQIYLNQKNKVKYQNFIEHFAKIYTPLVLLLALILLFIPVFILKAPLNLWLVRSIALLVVSCPCALVIASPIAIYSAIGNLSTQGVLVKGGRYLEALSKIKALAFDKTRTLTLGKPILVDVFLKGNLTQKEVITYAASLAYYSQHPISKAIIKYSEEKNTKRIPVKDFLEKPGLGIYATIESQGVNVYLGKPSFIKEVSKNHFSLDDLIDHQKNEDKNLVSIYIEGKGTGIMTFTDKIKEEAEETINKLQKLDIETVILTGDNKLNTRSIGKKLNIKQIFSDLLPQDKTTKIQELKKIYENVGMVGDGINDAPALALADVGISMGLKGSDLAMENSGIIISNDRLTKIPYAIRISRETIKTIRISVIGAVLVKILFLILPIVGPPLFLGVSILVWAILADVGLMLAVLIFGLRLMSYKPRI